MILTLKGASGRWQVETDDLVGETPTYRTYLCTREGGEVTPTHLLQIAAEPKHNGALERSAYILGKLFAEAERLEAEYAKVPTAPGKTKKVLNYQLGFPEVTDTLRLEEQDDRRVNILKFRDVPSIQSMVPLQYIVHRDRRKVDLKSSVWIMGKLLKCLTLPYSLGIAVGDISLGNILIEPDNHYVVIFDWASARLCPGAVVERETIREEIQAAARCVIELLGGTPEKGIPDDGTKEYGAYATYLMELATSGETSAVEAHAAFYAVVDSLWPRKHHPFITVAREGDEEES